MYLKTENSRRVAKSRPVCMGLKPCIYLIWLYMYRLVHVSSNIKYWFKHAWQFFPAYPLNFVLRVRTTKHRDRIRIQNRILRAKAIKIASTNLLRKSRKFLPHFAGCIQYTSYDLFGLFLNRLFILIINGLTRWLNLTMVLCYSK
jgi:hypothetical protein